VPASDSLIWPSWPQYTVEHAERVKQVVSSNQLFAAKEVKKFEKEFSSFVGSTYSVGVGNATQALHLALASNGISVGDEVIVTPYSWISSASCVLMQHAIPIFVDIESRSYGICPEALEQAITPHTKAVVLVHMFGLASEVIRIREICDRYNLLLIEDASHAHGARLNGKNLGTFGDLGIFSLHQRKALSTGDGGIICTNNLAIRDKIWRMRSFGDDQLSYNYRMTEFAGVLGQLGLKSLPSENHRRVVNHNVLANALDDSPIRVIDGLEGVEPVYYSNLLDIDLPLHMQRELCVLANAQGIPIKRTWQPLNKHPHFKRSNMPKNITPWDLAGRQICEPEDLQLQNSSLFQERRLFELECHPHVATNIVEEAGHRLKAIIRSL